MQELTQLIIKIGQQQRKLELSKLLNDLPCEELIAAAKWNVGKPDMLCFWNYTLLGCSYSSECDEKRFLLVMSVLQQTKIIELNTKQNFDIVSRLFIDLPNLFDKLNCIVEFCLESMGNDNAIWMGWKDLLPEILKLIHNSQKKINVNGCLIPANEYCNNIVKVVCGMNWSNLALISLSGLFKDVPLTKNERSIIISKILVNMQTVEPVDLPALTFQLFLLCQNSSLLMMAIMALEKYFYKHFYKNILSNCDSETTSVNCIDLYSDKEMREAEETVFFHLKNCTEFKIEEKDIVNNLKPLCFTPEYILTPFMISALIAISKINNHPDSTKLSSSPVLSFLCNIIKNNEFEKKLSQNSAWCRSRIGLHSKIDMGKIFMILTTHSKSGMEIITPGLINLSFSLLRTRNMAEPNALAITFLQHFIKTRFLFANGIMKKISGLIFADHECFQYAECLAVLSVTNTLTISECTNVINNIMDYLLLIDGRHAMRIMSFIFPLIKLSHIVRDKFIDMLRTAMYHRDVTTRQMSVFGFCSLLKQIKNNNSRRNNNSGLLTQTSGLSFISQTAIANDSHSHLHFDMLCLEIMGILRKCFNQCVEIKIELYENLSRAVEFNTQLLPHVLQFMEWHFRSYFNLNSGSIEINFLNIFQGKEVYDHLGHLLNCIIQCVILGTKYCNQHDISNFVSILNLLLNQIENISLENIGIVSLDFKSSIISSQFLNCVEALMVYCGSTCNINNNRVQQLNKLFLYHQKCTDKFKKMETKKSAVLSREDQTQDESVTFKLINIWDLRTIVLFLQIIYSDSKLYATSSDLNVIRSNKDFELFVLKTATTKIESLRSAPDYLLIKHSKRIFGYVCTCTNIIFEKCVSRIVLMDSVTAQHVMENFKETLLSIDHLYIQKIDLFFKLAYPREENIENVCYAIHKLVDEILNKDLFDDGYNEKILLHIFKSLEMLYKFMESKENEQFLSQAYNWFYNLCHKNKFQTKSLGIVNKMLFDLRLKTHTGEFFNMIAIQLSTKFGQIIEEEIEAQFILKSINSSTAESCLIHLCNVCKSQISHIEFIILKCNSMMAQLKMKEKYNTEESIQKIVAMDRSICCEMMHICYTLTYLSNSQIPLGACMDTFIKILIITYSCLVNLTKHFLSRDSAMDVSYSASKYELVVRSTKQLASNIYELITYIEENIFKENDEQNTSNRKKKSDSKIDKDKVIRGTKYIPKLVFHIENYNKYVILLSQKSKKDFSNFLHIGTVRDFRIKTSALLEAIENSQKPKHIEKMDSSMDRQATDAANLKSKTIPFSSPVGVCSIIEKSIQVSDQQKLLNNLAQLKKKRKTKLHVNTNAKKRKGKPNPPQINKDILKLLSELPSEKFTNCSKK